ncbi:hypothetical protein EV652_101490 [Kribbella steppae]|uniref:Tachylectin n=1 Tax=Kribbella steppae TaxID=2512223 RepID=A0A4R2HWR4_9ACTN|nr:hypothetical protein [Kribbella steppae]TCO35606.1 hypothetical protein EV652_101490 [Kribbella steppae]
MVTTRSTRRQGGAAVLGLALLAVGLAPGTAGAARQVAEGSTTATAACKISLASVTADGDHGGQDVTATSPPTATSRHTVREGVLPAGQARLSSTFVVEPDTQGNDISGRTILGDSMYDVAYETHWGGETDPVGPPRLTKVGGGWGAFTAFETSNYETYAAGRSTQYGLRRDGVLFRWTVDGKRIWHRAGSYAGFASVKTMALISKTRTYDTFLMNTRGGALYTVRIPISSPMKPVVKLVRSTTWQGFESFTAQKCGQYGVLLLGIDKDTGAGYLYAVGHANGTSTVIKGLGKVPGTFNDPVYFRWGVIPVLDPIFGE